MRRSQGYAAAPHQRLRRMRLAALALAGAAALSQGVLAPTAFAQPPLASTDECVVLTPREAGSSFDFDTEYVAGTIRLDGNYHGVSRLVDKRTGRQLIAENLSALNLYRLTAVNQLLAIPRTMERSVEATERAVVARWNSAGGGSDEAIARLWRGELSARYEVRASGAIEVTVTVRPARAYAGFEVFLPSYVEGDLVPHVFLQPRGFEPGNSSHEPELIVPTVNDAFRGTLLAFPRDEHAARRCVDGRWDRLAEIQVCPVRHYGYCLAFLTDPKR